MVVLGVATYDLSGWVNTLRLPFALGLGAQAGVWATAGKRLAEYHDWDSGETALLFAGGGLAGGLLAPVLSRVAPIVSQQGMRLLQQMNPSMARGLQRIAAFANRPLWGAGSRVGQAGAAPSTGAKFKTWNQFQAGTKGQFASRAEAGAAWSVYKQANGITTGTTRSMAARAQYLRSLVDDYRTPSWMKPWLAKGRLPPGCQVDHIKPLSIGGADTPANMRLQGEDLHTMWHRYYDPWNW